MTTPTLPNTYIVGQIVFLEDTITDPATGLGIDDATDAVTVYLPDGTHGAATTGTHDGVSGSGRYVAQFTPTQVGWHTGVWLSNASGAGGAVIEFWVRPVP